MNPRILSETDLQSLSQTTYPLAASHLNEDNNEDNGLKDNKKDNLMPPMPIEIDVRTRTLFTYSEGRAPMHLHKLLYFVVVVVVLIVNVSRAESSDKSGEVRMFAFDYEKTLEQNRINVPNKGDGRVSSRIKPGSQKWTDYLNDEWNMEFKFDFAAKSIFSRPLRSKAEWTYWGQVLHSSDDFYQTYKWFGPIENNRPLKAEAAHYKDANLFQLLKDGSAIWHPYVDMFIADQVEEVPLTDDERKTVKPSVAAKTVNENASGLRRLIPKEVPKGRLGDIRVRIQFRALTNSE